MKNKALLLILILAALVLLTSCSTTSSYTTRIYPHTASVSFPASGPYEILGRVDYVSTQGLAGFSELLKHAKEIYPTADDVVNILVDTEEVYEQVSSFFLGTSGPILKSAVYTMTGIAIRYTE
ncbi:MAG: hypothetical protein ACOX0W_01415 [Sphaerochaetaceae bacterium]|jgi:hypothetical protein